MLIPSLKHGYRPVATSLSRRVNANSQLETVAGVLDGKLIKKGEC